MNNTLGIFSQRLRPDAVSGQYPVTTLGTGEFDPAADRRMNLGAFSAPAPFRFGTAPPTSQDLRTFAYLNEDFALTKETRIGERVQIENYGQFFNAFNRHRFHSFENNFSSASFGRPRGVSLPRFIQLGIRVRF
jgi:hypothetical protein